METLVHNPDALHWLWVIAGLAVAAGVGLAGRRRRLRRFADVPLLGELLRQVRPGRAIVRAVLVFLSLLALVGALLDVRLAGPPRPVEHRGLDLLIVLDVSRSMLAEDVSPNRLERARQFIGDLIDASRGDRVGLITFAGTPVVRIPLTLDANAVRLTLREAGPQVAARGGSLLGDALRLAADSFPDDLPEAKAIIVFTDGEDHGSFPAEAAAQVRAQTGARVFTVGLGDADEGARIPIGDGARRRFVTHEGQEVWSKMDATTLEAVAEAGAGAFIPAGTRLVDMLEVYDRYVLPMSRREFQAVMLREQTPQYQWFAAVAVVLLLVEASLSDRRAQPQASAEGATV